MLSMHPSNIPLRWQALLTIVQLWSVSRATDVTTEIFTLWGMSEMLTAKRATRGLRMTSLIGEMNLPYQCCRWALMLQFTTDILILVQITTTSITFRRCRWTGWDFLGRWYMGWKRWWVLFRSRSRARSVRFWLQRYGGWGWELWRRWKSCEENLRHRGYCTAVLTWLSILFFHWMITLSITLRSEK